MAWDEGLGLMQTEACTILPTSGAKTSSDMLVSEVIGKNPVWMP